MRTESDLCLSYDDIDRDLEGGARFLMDDAAELTGLGRSTLYEFMGAQAALLFIKLGTWRLCLVSGHFGATHCAPHRFGGVSACPRVGLPQIARRMRK
jgi:hypothetical protein